MEGPRTPGLPVMPRKQPDLAVNNSGAGQASMVPMAVFAAPPAGNIYAQRLKDSGVPFKSTAPAPARQQPLPPPDITAMRRAPDLGAPPAAQTANPGLYLGNGTPAMGTLQDIGELKVVQQPARWRYSISTGQLYDDDQPVGVRGYSGTGKGRDNPAMVREGFVGPIPPGRYRIGPQQHHPHLGPVSMHLKALSTEQLLGRQNDFFIHGDNGSGDSSKGCIVLPRNMRTAIAKGGGDLEVTSD